MKSFYVPISAKERTCNPGGNGGGRPRSPALQDRSQGRVWYQVRKEGMCQLSVNNPESSSMEAVHLACHLMLLAKIIREATLSKLKSFLPPILMG